MKNYILETVAKGVETQQTLDLLTEIGVDLIQGYFISQAMSAEDFLPWSMAWNKKYP